jgi:hypothetical protein
MVASLDSNAIESELARLRETQLDRAQIDEIVRGLGELIGVEGLELDESGVAELVIDDDVELSLIHLPAFPGVVAAIPMPEGAENDGPLLRKLLQTNMTWALTQGGSFVFVPPRVALCRLIPLAPSDSERLDRELATFVELAKAWRNEITAYLTGEGVDEDDAELSESEDEFVGIRV